MNNWDQTKAVFLKTLKKLVEMHYITKNEYISLEGIAAMFANDLREHEKEEEKRSELDMFFTILQKYFPEKMSMIMDGISLIPTPEEQTDYQDRDDI